MMDLSVVAGSERALGDSGEPVFVADWQTPPNDSEHICASGRDATSRCAPAPTNAGRHYFAY